MQKIFFFSLVITISSSLFAQCDPATIKDMPSVYTYSKGNTASYKAFSEQDKYLTTIFKSVVEPAIKTTKGLTGSWNPIGNFKATAEGFTKSVLESFMLTLGCKDNKLYKKDEQGLVLSFTINSFQSILKSSIAQECSHEETTYKKFDESKTLYIDDLLDGKQIYYRQPSKVSDFYPAAAFYRKTDEGEYFVISKPGVDLFVPLTLRQALEINKKNFMNILGEHKRKVAMPGLQPETKADYEKSMAKEFAAYRESIPNPEKFISDLIKQLEETKLSLIKQDQFFTNAYTKQIALVTAYLKNTPADKLDKPFRTGSVGFLGALFGDDSDNVSGINSCIENNNSREVGSFVTLNPAYFNKTVSKTVPQFISIELRTQGNSAVTLKAYNNFKANLDFNKLQALLVK